MRDISRKVKSLRTACARATLKASAPTIKLLKEGKIPKGDPLPVAKVAAIQAAKNTSQLIPYCHPLPVDFVGVEFTVGESSIDAIVTVKAIYKTGVEMEALTGASVAVLTLYDMMKMLDEDMEITGISLVRKTGGKSDFVESFEKPLRAAVVVLSDSVAAGRKEDVSGKVIVERLKQEGLEVVDFMIISDDLPQIVDTLKLCADEMKCDLIVTTGGTGFSPRDSAPEAVASVFDTTIPGIPEAARAYGQERTPYAMLSRAQCGLRGKTMIINLPGSQKGVVDSLDALFPAVLHSFKMIWGGGHLHAPDDSGRSHK